MPIKSDVYSDGYYSDLMGDEEDRIHLNSLQDIEREQILNERYERLIYLRQKLQEKKKVQEQIQELKLKEKIQKRFETLPQSQQQKKEKQNALQMMTLQRKQKKLQKEDVKQGNYQSESSENDNGYSIEYDSEEESLAQKVDSDYSEPQKKKKVKKVSKQFNKSSEESENEVLHHESESSSNEEKLKQTDQDEYILQKKKEYEKIRLNRDTLNKFVGHSFFKKTVVGCYVRMLSPAIVSNQDGKKLNPMEYYIGKIVDVVEVPDKPYKIDPNIEKSKITTRYLKIARGKREKLLRISFVSNQSFSTKEFTNYYQILEQERIPQITKHFVEEKYREIKQALHHQYNEEEINQQVEQNIQYQIDKLLEKDSANCEVQIQYLESQITDLENQIYYKKSFQDDKNLYNYQKQKLDSFKQQIEKLKQIHEKYKQEMKINYQGKSEIMQDVLYKSMFQGWSNVQKSQPAKGPKICGQKLPNCNPIELKLNNSITYKEQQEIIKEFLEQMKQFQQLDFDLEIDNWILQHKNEIKNQQNSRN